MKLSLSIVDNAGIKTPFVLRGDYFNNIKVAKSIGYDAVEIHIRDPASIDTQKLKEECQKQEISVSSIGTGLAYVLDGLCLMSNDAEIRKMAVERINSFIRFSEAFGSVVIIGLIRGNMPTGDNINVKKYENRVIECLNTCINEAEKRKVILVVEAINRYESNFLVNIEETIQFINKFDSNKLKVHIDTFHMNIEEAKFRDSILKCGDKLGHVHFSDNDRMYPGHGHIAFEEIFKALKEIGYKGFVAIESLPLPEPLEAAKKTYEFLVSLKNKL
jgi:5-keto-L-gluconate epimerase